MQTYGESGGTGTFRGTVPEFDGCTDENYVYINCTYMKFVRVSTLIPPPPKEKP